MPSNKDILEAQRFNRRRLVTAFTSGTPGGKELESKSTTRPLILGASLAALAVLIAVAVGRFVPTLPSGWQDSHLIITKAEGARYYSIEGTLRPVSNVTSAKLLSESGKLVTSSVSTSSTTSQLQTNCTPTTGPHARPRLESKLGLLVAPRASATQPAPSFPTKEGSTWSQVGSATPSKLRTHKPLSTCSTCPDAPSPR